MVHDSYSDEEFKLDEVTVNSDVELLKLAYRNELVQFNFGYYY